MLSFMNSSEIYCFYFIFIFLDFINFYHHIMFLFYFSFLSLICIKLSKMINDSRK